MSTSRIAHDLDRGLRRLEKALTGANSFTWNGTDYPCVASQTTLSQPLAAGGFALEADLTLYVRRSALPGAAPTENQTVIWRTRRYRIDRAIDLPGAGQVKLICNAAPNPVVD